MDRLKEIEARKLELRELLEDETKEVDLEAVKSEIDSLDAEIKEIETSVEEEEKKETEAQEERKEIVKALEERSFTSSVKEIKENESMKEERKFTTADKEYRSAWAKTLMGVQLEETEKRALGDAIGTTATTFVASDADTQGINNGGLFIPDSVRNDFLEIMSEESPIFRDIRKLAVNGNIDLPYLFNADDASWYAELVDTKNEGQEFRSLKLTGHELAKDIVITWKLEEMAVEEFIAFILDELREKMGKALINAVIYGDGNGKPTGITNGLTAVKDGVTPIENIIATYTAIPQEERKGAKVYISTQVGVEMVSYKDENGNYPFLQGVSSTKLFSIEVDPYLQNNDVVAGNCRNYILNTNTPVRVDKESTIKGRKVTYGAYGIFDGNKKPNSFAYGQYTPSV